MALRSQPPPAIFPILESEAEEEEGEEQAPLAARKPDVPRGTLYKSISHQRGGARGADLASLACPELPASPKDGSTKPSEGEPGLASGPPRRQIPSSRSASGLDASASGLASSTGLGSSAGSASGSGQPLSGILAHGPRGIHKSVSIKDELSETQESTLAPQNDLLAPRSSSPSSSARSTDDPPRHSLTSRRTSLSHSLGTSSTRRSSIIGEARAALVSPFADVTPATKSDDSPRASTESLEYEPPPGFNLAGNPHAPEYALRQRGSVALDPHSAAIGPGASLSDSRRASIHHPLGTDILNSSAFRRMSVQLAESARASHEPGDASSQKGGLELRPSEIQDDRLGSQISLSSSRSQRRTSMPARRSSLISIEQILADREAEEQGYHLTGKPRRDCATQTDEEITNFEVLDGIYNALRDELEITEEMVDVSQRQRMRLATSEIYNRMGSQLLKMEQAYRASLHNVRSQCQATLKDAIGKVNKDNQRYDDWIISEAEERYQQLRKPLETVAEVSSTHLRRRQEEIQRLRYTCSRLYSVLARQGILSEEELRVAEAERAWVSDILSDYQSAIVDRDEEIQLLRHEVARLDALQDEFDRSLDRSAAFEKTVSRQESPLGQGRRGSRTNNVASRQHETAPIPTLDALIQNMNFSSDSLLDLHAAATAASAFPQKDADAQQIEQITQHYEEVIHNLEIVHAEEIASLIRKRDDVGAKWAVKIRSATRLKDDSGTLKVLHRQERLISLAQKMNRPRPLKDAETTAYISGVTLAMLLESQRHEDEKKAAEARAAETQAAEKRELKERMKRAHEELKRTQSRSNNKLDAVLRSRVASSVRGGMMRTSICGR
ncbi:hypothetical protein HK105_206959 [Polyrhizophydium stewartii]|uniref:DUF4709 domain-containing protein n=1 Tax=Polyrhizophydium stewartii TaxID=2732419 RepID=A0ABR4N1W6_9FUNG